MQLHTLSPELIRSGDLDGNGQADLIVDFGPGDGLGLKLLINSSSWMDLHPLSP